MFGSDAEKARYAVQHLELWLESCDPKDRPGMERAALRFRSVVEMDEARDRAMIE